MKNGTGVYLVIVLFALLVLSGFYLMLDKIGSLRTDLKNLELTFGLLEKQFTETKNASLPEEKAPSDNPQPPAPEPPKSEDVSINTTILFIASSSPALQPQTKITVMVEKVSKSKDGTVKLNFRALTNEATAYSAFEPRYLFEIVNLTGENLKPLDVTGKFDSIPPNTSSPGEITFKIEPSQNTLILQIGSSENIKFYEFNFSRKTYKETAVG